MELFFPPHFVILGAVVKSPCLASPSNQSRGIFVTSRNLELSSPHSLIVPRSFVVLGAMLSGVQSLFRQTDTTGASEGSFHLKPFQEFWSCFCSHGPTVSRFFIVLEASVTSPGPVCSSTWPVLWRIRCC